MTLVDRTESGGKNSLISIDLARAFRGLVSVCLPIWDRPCPGREDGTENLGRPLAWPGAVFAVPLFFALSGFCIHGAEWHRFRKTGLSGLKGSSFGAPEESIPYLLAIGISIAVNALAGKHDSGIDVLVHAFLLQGFSDLTSTPSIWCFGRSRLNAVFISSIPLWLMLRIKHGLFFAGTGSSDHAR